MLIFYLSVPEWPFPFASAASAAGGPLVYVIFSVTRPLNLHPFYAFTREERRASFDRRSGGNTPFPDQPLWAAL